MASELYRLYGAVEFDRPINPNLHYISPGGYEAKFTDGRTLSFDFCEFEGWIRNSNHNVLEWVQKNPDESFEGIQDFKYQDFVKKFDGFEDFFIYTGEGEDPEINPVKALNVTFEFYDNENDKFLTFKVPKNKLPTW